MINFKMERIKKKYFKIQNIEYNILGIVRKGR
jgi:hypothetical protein